MLNELEQSVKVTNILKGHSTNKHLVGDKKKNPSIKWLWSLQNSDEI